MRKKKTEQCPSADFCLSSYTHFGREGKSLVLPTPPSCMGLSYLQALNEPVACGREGRVIDIGNYQIWIVNFLLNVFKKKKFPFFPPVFCSLSFYNVQ